METFKITTIYPDGTIEERDATPEEVAKREEDVANGIAFSQAREQAIADTEAKRASAIAKLQALGLTEEEAKAVVGV